MTEAAAHEVAALALRAQRKADELRRAWRRFMVRLGMQDDYRAVFCGGGSQITPAGARVLRDLARQANFGRIDPQASEAALRENEGARRMLLHIIARIDAGSDELRRLSEQMKEKSDGR